MTSDRILLFVIYASFCNVDEVLLFLLTDAGH